MSSKTLINAVNEFHAALVPVVQRWTVSLGRVCVIHESPEDALAALVIPAGEFVRPVPEVAAIVRALSGRWLKEHDDDLRGIVGERVQRLSAELAGHGGQLLRLLSDLAYEHASHRMVILSADCHDVTAASVLMAAAHNNYLSMIAAHVANPSREIPAAVQQSVRLPLRMAGSLSTALRPGDLWVLDLFARSARHALAAAQGKPAQRGPKTRDETRAPLIDALAQFTTASSVQKLVEADQFEVHLAQRSRYKIWPGLETLIVDPGASGLRRLLVGEVARRVAADSVGLARGAMTRFLEALLALSDRRCQLRSRVLIAVLLWEMLEQDKRLLGTLCADRRYIGPLQAAVRAIEQDRRPPEGQRPESEESVIDHDTIDDVCSCLESCDQYRALVATSSALPTIL